MNYQAGQVVRVTATDVAHGGWCVARPEDGPVVFVRHALPGETVLARITEVTSRLARAEAVEVLTPSPNRVEPPCPYARPGGCGGCDWQHVALPAQRELKAAVIRQQLKRLAGLDREVTVEALAGDEPERRSGDGKPGAGLGWRTRVQYAVGPDGAAGLRAHRSHEVVGIDECLIAHPAINDLGLTGPSLARDGLGGGAGGDGLRRAGRDRHREGRRSPGRRRGGGFRCCAVPDAAGRGLTPFAGGAT